MGIPDHPTMPPKTTLPCLLRNLYAAQEATARTGHGTMDWFKIAKWVHQGCMLSLCLFNLYAEYIRGSARLDESQAGIQTARWNINNFRYADDTTLMAENEEELKSLLISVKEESEKKKKRLAWNSTLKNIKIVTSGPISSWSIEGEKVEAVTDFIFLVPKITAVGDCSH